MTQNVHEFYSGLYFMEISRGVYQMSNVAIRNTYPVQHRSNYDITIVMSSRFGIG